MDERDPVDNFFRELMVVLVIYKMEIDESPAFISLTNALKLVGQKTSILIYDNSPNAHTHTLNENWIITYRYDVSNQGVSKAYNESYEFAKSQNKKWLLLVDQDSAFPTDTFKLYKTAIERFNCSIIVPRLIDQIGIVSPLKFYLGGGQRQPKIPTDRLLSLQKYFFHNSGLLISIEEFEKAGRYDENFPLDFSDFSFVIRLRTRNDFFSVADIFVTHDLAATSSSNLNERLARFSTYLKAGHNFKNIYMPWNMSIKIRLFLRALKLAFQYQSFEFIVLYFR